MSADWLELSYGHSAMAHWTSSQTWAYSPASKNSCIFCSEVLLKVVKEEIHRLAESRFSDLEKFLVVIGRLDVGVLAVGELLQDVKGTVHGARLINLLRLRH